MFKLTYSVLRSLFFAVLATVMFASQGFARTTEEVWQHHIQAWEDRSLSEIISDYREDSRLIINNEVFMGRQAITQVFAQLFKIFDGGLNRIDPPIVFDRFVYISWHFTPAGKQEIFGTDTFVVESGAIVLQTIGSPLYDLFPVGP